MKLYTNRVFHKRVMTTFTFDVISPRILTTLIYKLKNNESNDHRTQEFRAKHLWLKNTRVS